MAWKSVRPKLNLERPPCNNSIEINTCIILLNRPTQIWEDWSAIKGDTNSARQLHCFKLNVYKVWSNKVHWKSLTMYLRSEVVTFSTQTPMGTRPHVRRPLGLARETACSVKVTTPTLQSESKDGTHHCAVPRPSDWLYFPMIRTKNWTGQLLSQWLSSL